MDERKGYVDSIDAMLEGTKQMRELYQNEFGEIEVIQTGFREVDRMLGGLRKKNLILLASRPGMGKTSLGLRIARNVAEKNKVLFFSAEMTRSQLGERLFSMVTGITLERIQKHDLTKWDLESGFEFIDYWKSVDMAFSEEFNPAEIKRECLQFKQEKGGLDFVVIDYLELLSIGGYRVDQRDAEVAVIINSLKAMAEEIDCAVLLMSQLSRGSYQGENGHISSLSDLRDYDAIEQSVDVVMLLDKKDYHGSNTGSKHSGGSLAKCEINIVKNGNGPTGTTFVYWAVIDSSYSSIKSKDH